MRSWQQLSLSWWSCSRLFKRLVFTFTGFITLTFSSKGKYISNHSLTANFFADFLMNLSAGCICDLFRWYQIKISMRYEDSDILGTPTRVVQYEGNTVKLILVLFILIFIYSQTIFPTKGIEIVIILRCWHILGAYPKGS